VPLRTVQHEQENKARPIRWLLPHSHEHRLHPHTSHLMKSVGGYPELQKKITRRDSFDVWSSWSKLCILEVGKVKKRARKSTRCLDQPCPILKVPCNNVSVSKISKGKPEHGSGTNLKNFSGLTEQEMSSEEQVIVTVGNE